VDFDGDGIDDLISGSYDPGTLHVFRGQGKGKFAARETIQTKEGKPVLAQPGKEPIESFGSFLTLVDWDDDGDLDIVIGTFGGEVLLCKNEGTRTKPAYATANVVVEAGGKPLKLPSGHAAVVAADWDGDGRFDLLSGCDNGAVYFFRNAGKKGEPALAEAVTLVPPHAGVGYEELQLPDTPITQGIRAQIGVADYNGDGKLDLLVGDFCTRRNFRPDLTADEKAKVKALAEKLKAMEPEREKIAAWFKEETRKFWEPIPVKEQLTPEVQKKYKDLIARLQKEEQYVAHEKAAGEVNTALETYLAKPEKASLAGGKWATAYGNVWLYLRK